MRPERRPLLRGTLRLAAMVLLAHVLALGVLLLTGRTAHAAAQAVVHAAPPSAAPAPVEWGGVLDLQKRLKDVAIEVDANGTRWLVLESPSGPVRLTPEEFALRLEGVQAEQERHGFLFVLFNITTPWGVLWVALGFLGQALFTLRMLLQWWASEKERRSVVPVAFWWGSLFGGAMLFVYFLWRKDIVGIVGQSTGIFIYARNLVLIHRSRSTPGTETETAKPQAV